MNSKMVNRKKSLHLSTSTIYILPLPTLMISFLIFKLYSITNNSKFLFVAILMAVSSIISIITILHFVVKKYRIDKKNPLYIFKSRRFENWLISSKFCKIIDDSTVEIPNISISMNKNDYYLDIQELYMIGDKLLEASSAINSYASQQNCELTIIECFRYKGYIRYHFIKSY